MSFVGVLRVSSIRRNGRFRGTAMPILVSESILLGRKRDSTNLITSSQGSLSEGKRRQSESKTDRNEDES